MNQCIRFGYVGHDVFDRLKFWRLTPRTEKDQQPNNNDSRHASNVAKMSGGIPPALDSRSVLLGQGSWDTEVPMGGVAPTVGKDQPGPACFNANAREVVGFFRKNHGA